MGKSLGIASFVILLLSLPIPIVGNYISFLAVLVLCGAAYAGEKTWVVIVDLVAWVKMFLLSPSWHLMMFGGGYMNRMARTAREIGGPNDAGAQITDYAARSASGMNSGALLFTIVILAAPIAILVWRRTSTTPLPGTTS